MISAVVITRNEEENVHECLSSLDFVDEIVVVDSGSSDRTLELSRNFTGKVFPRPGSQFYEAKNFGINQASGDWILGIDADERVPSELREEILRTVGASPRQAGFFIPRRNLLGKKWLKHGGQYPDWQLRLFKKGEGRFAPVAVHERVEVEGEVGYLDNALLHYTYRDFSDFLRKIDRYTSLEIQAGEEEKVSVFRLFYLPARKFFSTYVLRKGYKDGILGMAVCGLTAFYVFVKLVKAWERGEAQSRED